MNFSLKESIVRLTVIHDSNGNIASVAASPPDSPVMYLEMKPGQRMTEVEAPELKPGKDVKYIRERLTDLMDNQVVAIEPPKGKFKKKRH
jgi:hypothetical protein